MTNYDNLILEIREMFKERKWEQYNHPKNSVMSICSEAGELADIYRYVTEEESKNLLVPKQKTADEMADIFINLFYLADQLNIDITECIKNKLTEIKRKYPAERCKGKAQKYTEYIS